jgi:hypothetical protein
LRVGAVDYVFLGVGYGVKGLRLKIQGAGVSTTG